METPDFWEHQEQCGNRTDACDICGEFVKRVSMPEHYQECFEKLESEPKENFKRKKNNQTVGKKKGNK